MYKIKKFYFVVSTEYIISLECYSCQSCNDPFEPSSNDTIIINGTGLSCIVIQFLIDIILIFFI